MASFKINVGKLIHTVIIVYAGLVTAVTSSPVLTPDGSIDVVVNSSLQMTCLYAGLVSGDVYFHIAWYVGPRNLTSTKGIVRNDCSASGALNSSEYNVTCPENNKQSVTINQVDLTLQGNVARCVLVRKASNRSSSNELSIQVTVPVTQVKLRNMSTNATVVSEGAPTQFTCQTSACRPNATIYWYKEGTDGNADIITDGASTTFTEANDGLVITHSYLNYTFNRADQDSSIYCTANNGNNQEVRSPQQPRINVQYPPDASTMIEGYNNGDTIRMIENSTLSLVCVITGGNPRPVLMWNCNGGTQTNGSSGNTVTANITVTRRRDQDGLCRCSASHAMWSTSQMEEVLIEVLYPPTQPTIEIDGESSNGSVKVINNTDVPLNCNSSGKPAPDFSWTYQGITKTSSSVNILVDGNGTATCTASNNLTENGDVRRAFSSINFHILYGPNVPELFCYSKNAYIPISGSIDVIEGNNVDLSCTSDGDPTPTYSWNGTSGNTLTIPDIQRDMLYMCTAMNEPKPHYGTSSKMYASDHVGIRKLYGPRTEPTLIYIYNSTITTTVTTHVNVTENSTFNIICNNSDSRPAPTYRWTGDTTSGNGNLLVTEIKRTGQQDVNGASLTAFTCEVENAMVNTCGNGNTITKKTEHTVNVRILYPASIEAPLNIGVLEGKDVNLTADVRSHGSPRETYSWTYNNNHIADTLTHTLNNVSRHVAGYYTIEATNVIAATGFQPYQKTATRMTYIDVFYTTTISSFLVNGTQDKITVNESDTVKLECVVDSNPFSNVYIDASTYDGTKILAETQAQNTISHTIQTTTCWDAGSYRCYGYNNYTQNHSASNVYTLSVNCTPRPRFFTDQNSTFYEALGGRIELNLTVIAHPEPNEKSYRWWKLNNGDWIDVVNDTNINITTSLFASRLIVVELQEFDFGQYRLTVAFQGGTYNHFFFVAPKDKPQTPTQFTHRQEFVTQSSAVLTWNPGFNGGSAQTFYILYKKQSDPDWRESIVTPEGTNITITGLSPGTLYLVKMYAHNNQGNSSETTTITVTTQKASAPVESTTTMTATITTTNTYEHDGALIDKHEVFVKSEIAEPENPNQLPIIAGAAGGAGVAVIAVCIVIVVVVIRKRKQPESKSEQRQSLYKEETIYDENGMQINKAYESVESMGIQQPTVSGDVYAQVDKTKKENTNADNTYAVVDKSKKSGHTVQGQGPGDVYATPMKKKHGKGGKKTKTTKKKGNDVYENAHELNIYSGDGSNGASPDENIYENRQESQTTKRNLNKDGLLYADLAFNNNNKGQRKLVIHGLENATEYVQVDFTKKADPLPDSDDEGESA